MAQEEHSRKTAHDPAPDLAHARRGDRKAFSRLMEPYRRELIAYCYRLTGLLAESEDLAQEAFVRAFRALGTFEGRATPRAWLYRIAHNLCLNHVRRRPSGSPGRRWAKAPSLCRTRGSERENVRLGFVALVQSLPPRQRATLVLRDVLGWSAEETARILETTVPAVKNALARARQTLARQPSGGDPAEVRDLSTASPAARALVAEWVDAFEKGNTPRMVALLRPAKAGTILTESDAVYEQKRPRRGAAKAGDERKIRMPSDRERSDRDRGEARRGSNNGGNGGGRGGALPRSAETAIRALTLLDEICSPPIP